MPIRKKKQIVKVTVLGNPDDDKATDTEDMDLSKGAFLQYSRHVNADDVDYMSNDVFVNDTPPVSPRKIATVEYNAKEIPNPDVTVNTSDVDTNITNAETSS
ncbi:unnamed protein product [Lactuca virosa]|uniref:Uncharacterized protein n=1 Tax=Lactuca virosa TaxID=75947 RepID=A0AAU9MXJ8_9ASTR|nr:unnamed protein product [Lactuca virosa]